MMLTVFEVMTTTADLLRQFPTTIDDSFGEEDVINANVEMAANKMRILDVLQGVWGTEKELVEILEAFANVFGELCIVNRARTSCCKPIAEACRLWEEHLSAYNRYDNDASVPLSH